MKRLLRKQIRTLDHLAQAVEDKRSIITRPGDLLHCHQGRQPAIWVFNLNASQVHKWITEGMFLYPKPKKK
jgi:hypothetical protein